MKEGTKLTLATIIGAIIGAIIAFLVGHYGGGTLRPTSTNGTLPILGSTTPATIGVGQAQKIKVSVNLTGLGNVGDSSVQVYCQLSVVHQNGTSTGMPVQTKSATNLQTPDVYTFTGVDVASGDKLRLMYISDVQGAKDAVDYVWQDIPVVAASPTPTPTTSPDSSPATRPTGG
jgi:hypothetical protein